MTHVNSHTRASKYGTAIECPTCHNRNRVYHFSWSAITCQTCEELVDKGNWKFVGHFSRNGWILTDTGE